MAMPLVRGLATIFHYDPGRVSFVNRFCVNGLHNCVKRDTMDIVRD